MSFLLPLLLIIITLFALGYYWSCKVTNTNQFFVGNRQFGFILIAASLLAANIGAGTTVGAAGLGYQYGLTAWWWGGSAAIGTLLLTFIVTPKLWQLAKKENFLTLGDYIAFAYGKKLQRVLAWVLLLGSLFLLAAQLIALSYLLSIFTGVAKEYACIISGLIVVGYSAFGGLFVTARINVLQLIFVFLGFISAIYFLDFPINSNVATDNSTSSLAFDWILLLVPAFMISPGLIQKMYAAKDLRSIYIGGSVASVLMAAFAFFPAILGMSVWANGIGTQQAEWSLLQGIISNFPEWLGVLLLLAITFAELSTCDTIILMATSSLSVDLLSKYRWYQQLSQNQLLNLNRLFTIIMMIIGVILAVGLSSIISALSIFYTLVVIGFFIPIMNALFGKKLSERDMLFIVLASLVGTILFHVASLNLDLIEISTQLFGLMISGLLLILVYGKNLLRGKHNTSC